MNAGHASVDASASLQVRCFQCRDGLIPRHHSVVLHDPRAPVTSSGVYRDKTIHKSPLQTSQSAPDVAVVALCNQLLATMEALQEFDNSNNIAQTTQASKQVSSCQPCSMDLKQQLEGADYGELLWSIARTGLQHLHSVCGHALSCFWCNAGHETGA
jgi:hypothetical protein